MNANLFYAAAALGAVALFLLMQPRSSASRAALTIGGLAAVGLLLTTIARAAPAPAGATEDGPFWLYVLLALGAVAGAVRMVTHPRPVYAALYFILVIMSVAVLFLLMQAEFMAFALLIVYAGAILITYLFVLMLAQQAQHATDQGEVRGSEGAWYDRTPREPIAAVVLGFVFLAATGDALFGNERSLNWNASPAVAARANMRAWERLEDMPQLLLREASALTAAAGQPQVTRLEPGPDGRVITVDPNGLTGTISASDANGTKRQLVLDGTAAPSNARALGHALVAQFPVSLELAGVILLMAMFGAVVLARRQMEMAEDERRVAAGLPRLVPDEPTSTRGGAA